MDEKFKVVFNNFYSPPYDSPIEDLLAYNIVKYLDSSVSLLEQYEVSTICGNFRLDFVVQQNNLKYAIECDGRDYHKLQRDEWRDAMILGSGALQYIYRLRGTDLYKHIDDCIYLISQNHPYLFSDRGLINLEVLASEESKEQNWRRAPSLLSVIYCDEDGYINENDSIMIFYKSIYQPGLWKKYFDWAQSVGGGQLDIVIDSYAK
jgi:hypothetical protein